MLIVNWLLAVATVLAVANGLRRDRYEGVPPRIVWRQERLYRRPAQIWRRWARVAAGTVLLILAGAAGLMIAAVAAAACTLLAGLGLTWYGLCLLARRAEPAVAPIETFDDLDPDLFDPPPAAPEAPAAPSQHLEIP